MAESAPLLRLTRVSFGYDGREAIRSLSLFIAGAGITAVSGPNGSGKTTLLHLIAGLISPASGTVEIEGISVQSYSRLASARLVALMPQYLPYTPWLSVREVVELGAYPHAPKTLFPVFSRSESDSLLADVDAALDSVGIMEVADRLSGELSGGELRRVHLARALLQKPKILLLDEPTADLDLNHQGALIRLVRELGLGGVAVIVVTHDLNFASRLGGRLVLMKDGEVVAEGEPGELISEEVLSRLYPGGFEIIRTGNDMPIVLPSGGSDV